MTRKAAARDATARNRTLTALATRAGREGWPIQLDPELKFMTPKLAALHVLWSLKACDGTVPFRSEFNLRALKPFARHILLLERKYDPKARFQIRLLGSALTVLTGEHTGKYLDRVVPEPDVSGMMAVCEHALEARCAVRALFFFRQPLDHLDGEFFAAPLKDKDKSINLVLAALHIKAAGS